MKDGSTIDEHRLIVNVKGFDTVVHHKNGDKSDNRIENLDVMSRSEHSILHGLGRIIHGDRRQFTSDENGNAICRYCNKTKAWEDFAKNKSWSHGRKSICKECWNEYKRLQRNH